MPRRPQVSRRLSTITITYGRRILRLMEEKVKLLKDACGGMVGRPRRAEGGRRPRVSDPVQVRWVGILVSRFKKVRVLGFTGPVQVRWEEGGDWWGSVASGQAASLHSRPRTSSIMFFWDTPPNII